MSTGLNANDPTIVAAFRAALFHQGLVVLVLLFLLAVAWRVLRLVALRRAAHPAALAVVSEDSPSSSLPSATLAPATLEAPARKALRIGFAFLWILDGLLQAQPEMPLGVAPGVIEPAASASPAWVQHLVNAGATIWSFHPVTAAAATVWIQLGIGLFLLVAPRGRASRAAGGLAAGWGLLVWVFGEAFGGIFAPGLSWMFGAPGAVTFYALAGVLVALPERVWTTPRTGRGLLAGMGVFYLLMALLQAWPGRGFWQGTLSHPLDRSRLGTLAAMSSDMAKTAQPRFLSQLLQGFASFDARHGFAVNLFVSLVLTLVGAALVSGRRNLLLAATIGASVLGIADWLLVQDLGVFGGTGTDPNSMLPLVGVVIAGYVAVRAPAAADEPVGAAGALVERLATWRAHAAQQPSYVLRLLAGIGALGVVFVGAVPMAFASVQPHADTIIAQATDGTPNFTNFPAHNFVLTSANGKPLGLSSFLGKTVALTFLDPVCTSDCPVIAQEFKQADEIVGERSGRYEFVAVDANPLYTTRAYLQAFDRQEALGALPNWVYLTGPTAKLRPIWANYGVQDQYSPGGAMVAHTDIAYVIDPRGMVRAVLNADIGQGTEASQSSFAATLADALEKASNP